MEDKARNPSIKGQRSVKFERIIRRSAERETDGIQISLGRRIKMS
jgi:hypothetical protein